MYGFSRDAMGRSSGRDLPILPDPAGWTDGRWPAPPHGPTVAPILGAEQAGAMSSSGKKAWIAAALGTALAFAAAAPAVADVTAAEAIAALNAQREANGIPGGILENPSWSAGCDRHVTYMQRNDVLEHSEDSSLPGASPEGEEAGMSSVLSQGDSWADGNPWETAPIHLHQLLCPRLSVSGVADRDG